MDEARPETRGLLTFAIAGAGPTGVELAGALREILNHIVEKEYRNIAPADTRVVLLEMADRVLPGFPPRLSQHARESLTRMGVEVKTGVKVAGITGEGASLDHGGMGAWLSSRTILWAAGVRANPLAQAVGNAAGARVRKDGRVSTEPTLQLPRHPEILVLGDMAHCVDAGGNETPGLAAAAIQQGKHAARVVRARLRAETPPAFRYRDRGVMATIGRKAAVARLGRLQLSGIPAWFLWLFIHLIKLMLFENRVLVFLQWCWNYITWNRTARLVTQSQHERGQHKEAAMEHGGEEAAERESARSRRR